MIDLITWLRAQLDEDERIAQAASAGGRWRYAPGDSVGAWTLYDEHWRIASLTTYDTKSYDYAARMPAVRHPGYIDADANGRHIARHDPASVLSDIAAKRAILDTYEEARTYYDGPGRSAPAGEVHGLWTALQHLASAYADRVGYQEGWKP